MSLSNTTSKHTWSYYNSHRKPIQIKAYSLAQRKKWLKHKPARPSPLRQIWHIDDVVCPPSRPHPVRRLKTFGSEEDLKILLDPEARFADIIHHIRPVERRLPPPAVEPEWVSDSEFESESEEEDDDAPQSAESQMVAGESHESKYKENVKAQRGDVVVQRLFGFYLSTIDDEGNLEMED